MWILKELWANALVEIVKIKKYVYLTSKISLFMKYIKILKLFWTIKQTSNLEKWEGCLFNFSLFI